MFLLQAVRQSDVYYYIAQLDIRRSPPTLVQLIGFEQLEQVEESNWNGSPGTISASTLIEWKKLPPTRA